MTKEFKAPYTFTITDASGVEVTSGILETERIAREVCLSVQDCLVRMMLCTEEETLHNELVMNQMNGRETDMHNLGRFAACVMETRKEWCKKLREKVEEEFKDD